MCGQLLGLLPSYHSEALPQSLHVLLSFSSRICSTSIFHVHDHNNSCELFPRDRSPSPVCHHISMAIFRTAKSPFSLITSAVLIAVASAGSNGSADSISALASSPSTAQLNITAFGGISCDGEPILPTQVIVPQGRCSEFPPVASEPNNPIYNPIYNGYASCCYVWYNHFKSISLHNSDPNAFAGCFLTQFNCLECDDGYYSTNAGPLDKADACMRTVFDTGNDGLASNNQGVFSLRIDCFVGNSSSANVSALLGKILPSRTRSYALLGDPNAAPTGQSSKIGKGNSSTSQHLPAGCDRSARPSTHALSHTSALRLVTYVTWLDIISASTTTTITWMDKNDDYVPSKVFTVTGPSTPSATITQEIAPGKFFGPENRLDGKTMGASSGPDYCQGSCGTCSIYFPVANVLYWPVSSMETACLENKTTTAPQSALSASMGKRSKPSLSGDSHGQTVSNGFTSTSSLL